MTQELRKIDPNFPNVSPHILRHTFATRCVENGMNIKTLQKLLGHTNFKTTMDIYSHTTDDVLYEEMKKFEHRNESKGFGSLDVLKMDIILRLPLKAEHSTTECNQSA